MNSCSNIVVVILTYIVVELMQWASLNWGIIDELVVVDEITCSIYIYMYTLLILFKLV
jgi:hypothetical protein